MKRVLITGSNSYIGTSVETYMNQWPEEFNIDTLDVRDDEWRSYDFSTYDTVFHVAGIAHIKETANNADLYYRVNRDLAIDVAKLAKKDGAKQFIFLSSMSVYGINHGVITSSTPVNPVSTYGKSKLEAELQLSHLDSPAFHVAILRPPQWFTVRVVKEIINDYLNWLVVLSFSQSIQINAA